LRAPARPPRFPFLRTKRIDSRGSRY